MVVTNDCRKQSLVVALKVEWLNSYQSLMCIYKYSYLIFFLLYKEFSVLYNNSQF